MDNIEFIHVSMMIVNAMGGHGDQIFKKWNSSRMYGFDLVGISCSLISSRHRSLLKCRWCLLTNNNLPVLLTNNLLVVTIVTYWFIHLFVVTSIFIELSYSNYGNF